MKQKILIFLGLQVLLVAAVLAQTKTPARIVAGPMLGYSTHTECGIWVQTLNANETSIQYRVLGSNGAWQNEVNFNFVTSKNKPQAYKFYLSELEMGKTYEYQILLDGVLLYCIVFFIVLYVCWMVHFFVCFVLLFAG